MAKKIRDPRLRITRRIKKDFLIMA